ncbi:hypothetical protein, partial [Afifella marina]
PEETGRCREGRGGAAFFGDASFPAACLFAFAKHNFLPTASGPSYLGVWLSFGCRCPAFARKAKDFGS